MYAYLILYCGIRTISSIYSEGYPSIKFSRIHKTGSKNFTRDFQ